VKRNAQRDEEKSTEGERRGKNSKRVREKYKMN
jgi:hypothetical protein